MTAPLTPEQQLTLDAASQPPRLVDPRTSKTYVLLPEADYDAVRGLLEDERRQREIRAVALRNAGRRAGEEP